MKNEEISENSEISSSENRPTSETKKPVGILKKSKKPEDQDQNSAIIKEELTVPSSFNEAHQKSTLIHMTENDDNNFAQDNDKTHDPYQVHMMRHTSVSSQASYESADTLDSENILPPRKDFSSQAESIFFGDDMEDEA